MTRVDELQKRYPTIPREVIIKWDVLTGGVRDSSALDNGGIWINGIGNYTRDHDMTLAESVKDRPERVRPGWVRHPSAMYFRNGLSASVKRDRRSRYEVREESDGRFGLYEGEERVDEIWFPGAAVGEPGSKDFWPGALFSGLSKNCGVGGGTDFAVLPQSQHCGYFATGDQCRFCNYDSNHDDALAVGLRPKKATPDEVVERYRIRASKMRIIEATVGSDGAVPDPEKRNVLVDFYTEFLGRIANATPSYHPDLKLITMPLTRKQLQRLKDVGGDCVRSQMEVWDKRLFPEIVPGKSKQFGHEGYTEHLLNATDILGPGTAHVNFVGGVTLMPANGHHTWQEARDSMIDGFRFLIKNGVVPGFFSLRPVPGSVYGDDKSTLAKLPPTEFYLEMALGQHEAMMEYGLYEKMNKFLSCPLEGNSLGYSEEIGMIVLAGNPANWVADEVPHEINWLAKFIESVGSPAVVPAEGQGRKER